MLHIDKKTNKSYYTYTHKVSIEDSKTECMIPIKNKIKKPIENIENIEVIIDTLENCILNINSPSSMSVVHTLNTKLFRKMIREAC